MKKASKILTTIALILSIVNLVVAALAIFPGLGMMVGGMILTGTAETDEQMAAAAPLMTAGILLFAFGIAFTIVYIVAVILSAINCKAIKKGFDKKPFGLAIATIVLSVINLGTGISFILLIVAGILMLVAKPGTFHVDGAVLEAAPAEVEAPKEEPAKEEKAAEKAPKKETKKTEKK